MSDPLARPVWNALRSGWAHLAEGDGRAWRLERGHGVFAAAADQSDEALTALAALFPNDGALLLIEPEAWPVPPGGVLVEYTELVQMMATAITNAPERDVAIVDLSDADAAAMFELASLTRPGPFMPNTNRLGGFVGVRDGGRLVAMAGERMRMPGFTEVSGVCTHPDHRGKGYAAALMRVVAHRMLAKGETPFLHSYASNNGAIALYETLGFRFSRTMVATVVTRA